MVRLNVIQKWIQKQGTTSLCMSQESQEWGTSIPVSHDSHIGPFSSSTGEGSLIQGGKGAHWCMTDTGSPHHMTLGLEAVVYIQGLFSVCVWRLTCFLKWLWLLFFYLTVSDWIGPFFKDWISPQWQPERGKIFLNFTDFSFISKIKCVETLLRLITFCRNVWFF